jgi:hypothetical protein
MSALAAYRLGSRATDLVAAAPGGEYEAITIGLLTSACRDAARECPDLLPLALAGVMRAKPAAFAQLPGDVRAMLGEHAPQPTAADIRLRAAALRLWRKAADGEPAQAPAWWGGLPPFPPIPDPK